jgi:hypothetical protein
VIPTHDQAIAGVGAHLEVIGGKCVVVEEAVVAHVVAMLLGCVGAQVGKHERLQVVALSVVVDEPDEFQLLTRVADGLGCRGEEDDQ